MMKRQATDFRKIPQRTSVYRTLRELSKLNNKKKKIQSQNEQKPGRDILPTRISIY